MFIFQGKKKAFHTPCPLYQKGVSFFKLKLYI